MTKLTYRDTEKFTRLLKKLTKRFRTLPADLETAKKATIELYHLKQIDNASCFRLQYDSYTNCTIYKIKKFACRSLKGKGIQSGIRVTYAYFPTTYLVEFIEIYYKGGQTNESNELITEYLKGLQE